MNGFPDTGPGSDGRRSQAQWKNAMAEDMGLIRRYVEMAEEMEGDRRVLQLACALKEARRLESDLYRYAEEVYGIERDEMKRQRV